MSTGILIKGCKLKVDNVEFALVRRLPNGDWQLEGQATGELRNMPQKELLEGVTNGRVRFIVSEDLLRRDGKAFRKENARKQFELLPDQVKKLAKLRRHIVLAVTREVGDRWNNAQVRACIKKVWKLQDMAGEPPHPTTVWRWHRRYLASGQDIRSLVSAFHRSGNHTQRHPQEVETIVRDAVDRVYLTTERGTYQDALDYAITEISRQNQLRLDNDQLPLPKLGYIKRIAKEIPAFDREVARYGRQAAERRYRTVLGKTMAFIPLGRVEIDHTLLDVFVVDDETYLPLGRPWLTLCVDARTRAILGFYLGFDPPSYSTVARALKHAILPKTGISEHYPAVKGTWDMYGVMEGIVVDNGPEFHSESLEASCYSLGIDIQYCPRKQPWYKGIIERLLGSLNRGVAHGIPGTTFSNILEKSDYDAARRATITLKTLREIIHVWIIDYYHQRPHKGLGDTPAHAWRVETEGQSIRLPADPQDIDIALSKIATRRLTHKGIEINGLFYNSHEARDLMHRIGDDKTLSVRYDDDDLGQIQVLDPVSNNFIPVPALDQGYAKGLTLFQHQVCRRFAQRELQGRTDVVALAEAKQEIQALVNNDALRKGKKSRVRSARFMKVGKDESKQQLSSSNTEHIESCPTEHSPQVEVPASPAFATPPFNTPGNSGDFPVRLVQRSTQAVAGKFDTEISNEID